MGDPLVVTEPANTIIPIVVAIGAFLLFGWRLFPAYRQIWKRRRARKRGGSDLLGPQATEHLPLQFVGGLLVRLNLWLHIGSLLSERSPMS
jgi:hypothetical protein